MDLKTSRPHKFELPTVFVIFGITGDLAQKKIIKGLYNLHLKKLLPQKFQVYGFSRRALDDNALREYLRSIMIKGNYRNPEEYEKFLSFFYYLQGDFDQKDAYTKLAEVLGKIDGYWRICSNKLFYLAVPPRNYRNIIENLHDSGLTIPCSPEEGWTRVILEKPFGTDLQTAKELDALLGKLFKEEQIYRVDHFLAKETVRNILTFRFSNSLLTPAWNNREIERIHIRLYEKEGIGTRGDFYDKVGALRDVGQNHLLQLLALFVMDNPGKMSPEAIRTKRAEALSQLEVFTYDEVAQYTSRAQYSGYLKEKGVAPNSQTETYFKIKAFLNKPHFHDTPIYIESGKGMGQSKTEVEVIFKHQTPCLCPANEHYQNVLHYLINPQEKITMSFMLKKPGFDYVIGEQRFEFDYKKVYQESEFIEDYEQLMLDIIKGDQTRFVTTDEIFSQWKFVEPILAAWEKNAVPLITYDQGATNVDGLRDDKVSELKKEIGVVGLGKMGKGIALQLAEKGWKVVAYNRTPEKATALENQGIIHISNMLDFVRNLAKPRVIWLMVTAGPAVDEVLFGSGGLADALEPGDIVIDAGNSFYKDAKERAKKLEQKGIRFVDVGTSGGPSGARYGACLMIGGPYDLFEYLRPLYHDLSITQGMQHFEGIGAGHFVKMVHNGIEYGMMQSIGEGFEVMKKSDYNLDVERIAQIYNHGSVIESRLIGWLHQAYKLFGNNLEEISGTVGHTGEGEWTVNTAKELNVPVKVIQDSLQFRIDSEKKPSYTGKVISALRNMFGGHKVNK